MKLYLFGISLITLLSCSNQANQKKQSHFDIIAANSDTSYVWTKLLDSADWKKNYNFQMFSIKDTLWTFHPDGNWFSTDGVNWTKSSLSNSIYNLAFLDYVRFNNAVYGLGHFEGNIERFTFKPEIYETTDFKNWKTISKNNLPQRYFYHPFEYDNKLWIIGGEFKDRKYFDVWNSRDAITWTKLKENLPFGNSNRGQFLVFKNKIFMLRSDVWSSTDVLNWKEVTPAIVPGEEIFGYAAVVFDNKIWLLGCNRNGQFTSQVLVSADGKNWIGMNAPWTPRGGIAATVYRGKIYMTGGKYGGTANQPDFIYSNDVWTLEKKE